MQGGDISNAVSKRSIVVVDTFLDRQPKIKKILGFIPVRDEEVNYNRAMLSRYWAFSSATGRTLELVGFGMSQSDIERVMDDLDNLGTNPFNYCSAYSTIVELVAELPYRPEVLSVVDIPQRMLRYGSYAMDIGRV